VIAVGFHRTALWSQGAELNRMYYGTDTRADALFAGCLFAFLAQLKLPTRLLSALHIMALSVVVFLAYAICTLSFTSQFLYRGGYTLIALTTGILIWSVSESRDSWLARVLAFYPLRWFGFISYSLYLWHWLLLRNVSFYYFVGNWDGWVRLFAAVAIAAGSFYLVESRVNKLKTRFSYMSKASRKDSREVNAPLVVSFIQPSEQNS
jgi:peptidoglycan/LPS O-acetylase OafA/YrhL